MPITCNLPRLIFTKQKSEKDEKKKVVASLKNGDDELLLGDIILIFDNDETTNMTIDYDLEVDEDCGPDCFFAIFSGSSCDKKGDKLYDTDENPWTIDDGSFTSNGVGRAAGTKDMTDGHDYSDHHCRTIVIYGPPPDESRRRLKSGKDDGPPILMCGVLKEKDSDESCKKKSRRGKK